MNIWQKFAAFGKGNPTSSTDLKGAREEFVTDRDRLAGDLVKGQEARASVLRDKGPEALTEHQASLRRLEDDIAARDLAIEEIDRQLVEVGKVEEASALDQRASAAKQAMAELSKTRAAFFQQVEALLETMGQGSDLMARVRSFNTEAATLGKSSMKVVDQEMADLHTSAARSVPLDHPLNDKVLEQHLEGALTFRKLAQRLRDAA